MRKKIENKIFVIAFLLLIALPLLFTNLRENVVSKDVNRTLAPQAKLYKDDGTVNENFSNEFETWLNDHIGFRSAFVLNNAKIQYYVFKQLSKESNEMLGDHGELNYIGENEISDHQRTNRKSEEDLNSIAEGFQKVKDYTEGKGIQFYYLQCWDKDTIYPEQFPSVLNQVSDQSMTAQVVEKLKNETDIDLIDIREELIEGKKNYETYSRWGDPTHWSNRGAFIGYTKLMQEINKRNGDKYKILSEDDYNIEKTDLGATLFGGIHLENMLEPFSILNPTAIRTDEKLKYSGASSGQNAAYSNYTVDDTKVLILGDSYIRYYILDDLAESFRETCFIHKGAICDYYRLLEEYKPDIVLCEAAEREDNFGAFISAKNSIENHRYELGNDILFYSDNANYSNYVYYGMADRETYYTWTNGNEVSLSLTISDNSISSNTAKLKGTFDIDGVYNSMQNVQIEVNGNEVYEQMISNDDKQIEFLFDGFEKEENTVIKVKIPDAGSPRDNDNGDDGRLLGIKIKRLVISQQ